MYVFQKYWRQFFSSFKLDSFLLLVTIARFWKVKLYWFYILLEKMRKFHLKNNACKILLERQHFSWYLKKKKEQYKTERWQWAYKFSCFSGACSIVFMLSLFDLKNMWHWWHWWSTCNCSYAFVLKLKERL